MYRPSALILACVLAMAPVAAAQDKLPDGAVARLGIHRLRVPGQIFDSAFTPDGRTLVVVYHEVVPVPAPEPKGEAPNVLLFDVGTGLPRKRLEIYAARHVAMAVQKPLMVVDTTKGFELWDIAAEKLVKQWTYPASATNAHALAISPDGTMVIALAVEQRKSVVLRWESATGKLLPSLYPSIHSTSTLSISADGSKFFTADAPSTAPGSGKDAEKNPKIVPGEVIAWDAKTGAKLIELGNFHDFVAFSPDGAMIARSGRNDRKIEVIAFDASRKAIAEIPIPYTRFDFTPDGKQLAVQTSNNELVLWDIAANKEARKLEGQFWSHRHRSRFTQDGRLLAIGQYENWSHQANYVQFWDVTTGKQVRFGTGFPNTVNGLVYAPDGKTLATISMDTILIFDPRTGDELRRWVAHKSSIEQIAFSPDGKLLASASIDGTIALWDPTTGIERRRLTAKDSVNAIAFSRDGRTLLAVCSDRTVQKWNIEKAAVEHSYKVNVPLAMSAVSPTGRYLAFLEGDRKYRHHSSTLHWIDAPTGKTLPPIQLRPTPLLDENNFRFEGTVAWTFAFAPDSKLLATSDSLETHAIRMILSDHTVRIWETGTRREIMRFTNNPIGTRLLAISPDNRVLAQGVGNQQGWGHGSDQTLILRDISLAQSESLGHQPPNESNIPNYAEVKKRFRMIAGHQGSVTCLTFSPDSRFLATGGSDQVVYIWRVEDFFKRAELPETKEDIASLGKRLADANGGNAYQAIAHLERRPKETLAYLRETLRPVPTADEKAIRQHVRDLSNASYAIRQQAFIELERLGEQATTHLMNEGKNPPNLEVKRRVESLLEKLERPFDDAKQLGAYRALTLLERIGGPEARTLLEELARGAPSAWLTNEARHSLDRVR